MAPLFIALVVLSQQPLQPDAVLPPNHPPMQGGQAPGAPGAPGAAGQPGQPGQPGQAPTVEDLMKKLEASKELRDKDKPFEIAASLGKLYFSHGKYSDAVTFLEQAIAKASPVRDFYLQKKKAAGSAALPSPEQAGCVPPAEPKLDDQFALAKGKAKAAEAATCARAALQPLIEVEDQLASSKFLAGDKAGAVAAYGRSLELFPSNPDARYGRAAALLDSKGDDKKSLELVKADLELFLKDYPTSPKAKQAKAFLARTDKALAAGGLGKLAAAPPEKRASVAPPAPAAPMQLPPNHPPMTGTPMQARPLPPGAMQGGGPMQAGGPMQGGPMQGGPMQGGGTPPQLSPEVMKAMQDVKVTPEMQQGFDKLLADAEEHLAKGRYQDALNNYRQVMPFQPDARVRAGMAWTLIRLGKPTAENIWKVASGEPAAVDALGDALKAKGDADGARQLWMKLKDTVPAYAPRLEAKLR